MEEEEREREAKERVEWEGLGVQAKVVGLKKEE